MRISHYLGLGASLALTMLLASAGAQAAPRYGRAGCGLGSLIISPTGSQTSAYTSNQTSYTQPFGISSGTSNCIADKDSAAQEEQEKFINANLATVSKEMAQGSGDTLVAFSAVLGCPSSVFPVFSAQLKESYRDIFLAPGALAVLDASKERLKLNPVIAKQCTGLS